MFESRQGIFDSKIQIKPADSIGYINNRVTSELGVARPNGWDGFEVELPEGLSNVLLPPTLRTAEMFTVGKLLANQLNLSRAILNNAYESFKPAENRIISVNYHGKILQLKYTEGVMCNA